jgi:ABC-type bacteriocin/lantibiotic exporter with double-glycine peptidase domain
MTDLNVAYSYGNDDEPTYNIQQFQDNEIQQQPQIKKEVELPKQTPVYQQPIQQPQQLQQPHMQNYYQNQQLQQQQPVQQQYKRQRNPEYSFWDRMVMSRNDVIKLFILSIVIVLGISIEKIGYFYISSYLNENTLSTIQELLVRLSFPIIVFILLWIIKSL